jgi:putative membrane protein
MFVMMFGVALAVAQDQPGAGAGAGRDQDQGRTQQDQDRGAMPAGQRDRGGMDQQGMQNLDQEFVKHALSANELEIQLSQLVAQRGQDPQIKQFAQRMVEDHRQAQQQLRQVAQAINVSTSQQLIPLHQAKLQHFQQKQGKMLDIGYIFDQVGHHHKDVLEYQFVAQNAQNPQLKQFAQQCVPKLREHLQMAERIAPGGTEARTAGERIGPGQQQDPGERTGGMGHGGEGGRDRDR